MAIYMQHQAKLISLVADLRGMSPDEFAMTSEFSELASHWRSFWDSLPDGAIVKDVTCPGMDLVMAWWDDKDHSTHIHLFMGEIK